MARPKNKVPTLHLPPHFKGSLLSQLYTFGQAEVVGFGRFELVRIPQKKIYHNFSKRTRIIKAYNKLKFVQSAALKAELTGN